MKFCGVVGCCALIVGQLVTATPALAGSRSIQVFAGSASKPATEEVARRFTERTGIEVRLHLGGSGALLAQMQLSERGDIYFPGSSDFMDRAMRRGLVVPESEIRVAYLIPAINVAAGNPLAIQSLEDLARPGVRVGVARPEAVCVGLYAVEILENSGHAASVRPNIVNYAESCARTAQMLSLGLVDAVLGWSVFDAWDPLHIETVAYPPEQVVRIGYMPAAVAAFVQDRPAAQSFLDALGSDASREVFRRHGYFSSLQEARALALPDTPVGGAFPLPERWR